MSDVSRIGLIKADIGGEYLTERVLRIIEDSLKVPVVPRSNLNIKVDEDGNKHISYEDFPNTMTSFTNYSKMDIARDIKETVCKLIDIKQEGYYSLNRSLISHFQC